MHRLKAFCNALLIGAFLAWVGGLSVAKAEDVVREPAPPPPPLVELQAKEFSQRSDLVPTSGLQIRGEAIREAALSYGARGGLAWRTFEIQRRLAEHESTLVRTYDFKRLLISAPSGLLIEPPVISEAERAVIVGSGGQDAAVADRVYRIGRTARIVTAGRDWRHYLERDWGVVEPPPEVLFPRDEIERIRWQEWVAKGWEEGVRQADDIFQADLDRLTADFVGMVRYRQLLAQGIVTPTYAAQNDRGVTGGGRELRIGDRAVKITSNPQLTAHSEQWTPAQR
ncbi:MAG: type IV secretory system conjugative DNA transfer family protein [Alphaproteobacteria bacterium]|nr:MAG: type IV secretory system conjugative DNA transfer family protein [Alphaproteobacteria bacterium]